MIAPEAEFVCSVRGKARFPLRRVFERGAAHVALLAGCPTYPVAIRCEPRGLMRGQPWYDVPASRMRFSFAVGAPIASETAEASRGRAARKLTARYRAHFEKELGRSA